MEQTRAAEEVAPEGFKIHYDFNGNRTMCAKPHPQKIDCPHNLAVNGNFGFVLVTPHRSKGENSVAVMC